MNKLMRERLVKFLLETEDPFTLEQMAFMTDEEILSYALTEMECMQEELKKQKKKGTA